MSGQEIIIALVIGLVIGYVAKFIMGGNIGMLWCIVLGLIGSAVGNGLFNFMGWNLNFRFGGIVTGIIGACIVLFLAHRFSGK